MLKTYTNPVYEYKRPVDLDASQPTEHPIVIIGAGPVGMAQALDFAVQGKKTVILDDNNTVSVGSRAVCYAKRFIEICDRLGVGQRMVDKGVTWNVGKVFHKEKQVYTFNMLPEEHHRRPGFINLQQYYQEEYMVDRINELSDLIDLRWKNKVTQVSPSDQSVDITVETEDGAYTIRAGYLIDCSGANSQIREQLGLESTGQIFQDRFLIADVVMKADFPTERWFWFQPPFHKGHSTLLHKQSDDCWRIDFDLGWDSDPEEEKKPENVIPRIKAMLGEDKEFELEWVSVYTFRCRRMDNFRHGRIFFAGDVAHQVSPFGARGANSGIQDSDNLTWKMKLVMEGKAPSRLLDTYSEERVYAADENIRNSTRSTEFITPKSNISRAFRNAVLDLANEYHFARPLVNSGRLSVPATYVHSSLNTPDQDTFSGRMVPGAPSTDGPVTGHSQQQWFLNCIGNDFYTVCFTDENGQIEDTVLQQLQALQDDRIPVKALLVAPAGCQNPVSADNIEVVIDTQNALTERLDALPGTTYLFRPDQHVTGRWRNFSQDNVRAAVARATCND